jgi:uncharacterized protein (DUF2141 family)
LKEIESEIVIITRKLVLMKVASILILLILRLGIAMAEAPSNQVSLSIHIAELANLKGNLIVFLYQYENQFPMNPYKYYYVSKSEFNANGNFTITELEPGEYALAVIDDQNANNSMDFSWGVPQEGYAFSNLSRSIGLFTLPTFKKCAFDCLGSTHSINLTMNY